MGKNRKHRRGEDDSAALRALAPIRRAMLDVDHPADEVISYAADKIFEGYAAKVLLETAFNPALPRDVQSRYANLILDKAPWAVAPSESTPISSRKAGLHDEKNYFFVDKALSINDEALALRILKYGAKVSNRQLERARTKHQTAFVHYALSNLCSEQDIFSFLRDDSLPPQERQCVHQCLKKHFPLQTQQVIVSHIILRESHIRSFLDDFINRVILPSYFLVLSGDKNSPLNLSHVPQNDQLRPLLINAIVKLGISQGKSPGETLEALKQLSFSWRNPQIIFPKLNYTSPEEIGLPKSINRTWMPLIAAPFVTRNGYVVHNRTREVELKNDHHVMGHCIDEYAEDCCKETPDRAHVFTICSKNGDPLSSFQLELTNQPSDHYPTIKAGNKYLAIIQHEGKEVNGIKNFITSGPLHEALQEFSLAISAGKQKLAAPPYGETAESKAENALPAIIKTCGYFPSWENVNLTLQEFKKDIRRGASSIDGDGRLVYDMVTGADGQRKPIHLIDGTIEQNGKTLGLRNMNAQEWLHATGLMEDLHIAAMMTAVDNETIKPYTPPKRLTATLPPPETPEEHQRRMTRHAHAFNSATLDPDEVKKLSRIERAQYEGRLRELNPRKAQPYFDRA